MTLTLLMPWFPIILAVGVGGRMLGRRRGYALGLVSALFWIVLVQATAGVGFWRDAGFAVSVVLGAAAIVFMGGWAGEHPAAAPARRMAGTQEIVEPSFPASNAFAAVRPALQRYGEWMDDHAEEFDPWPAFGEFVRGILFECSGATHVKVYRISNDGAELAPLHEQDGIPQSKTVSARGGILGHVATTGRAYIQGDPSQGELIEQLAGRCDPIPAWVFGVSRGSKRLGVVVVGRIDRPTPPDSQLLATSAMLVSLFWRGLSDAVECRKAGRIDSGSGVLNRDAFLQGIQRSISESYSQGEPVALALIAVEGLRELNDSGRWELADQVIRESADAIRKKIRRDDVLGRFDGSRFIWLLRRVDSDLAELIVRQMMTRLQDICEDEKRWHARIHVRCGVVGSGLGQPAVHDLIERALTQSKRARQEKTTVACEPSAERQPVGASA